MTSEELDGRVRIEKLFLEPTQEESKSEKSDKQSKPSRPTRDSYILAATNGVKFAKDWSDNVNWLTSLFFKSFSFTAFAPNISWATSWIVGDKVACLAAVVNVYQNIKYISLEGLEKARQALREGKLTKEHSSLIKRTITVILHASIAGMKLAVIFSDRVGKSRVLGACNVAAFSLCVGSSILFDRWKFTDAGLSKKDSVPSITDPKPHTN